MTHPTPILSEYINIFDESVAIEYARAPEIDREKIRAYVENVAAITKLHTYFMEATMAKYINDVYADSPVRDFVLCLKDRFLIAIAGNEHISYSHLCGMIAAIGRKSGVQQYAISSSVLPASVAEGISPEQDRIVGILTDNPFLIVPVMLVLNVGIPTPQPPAKETKKS